MINNAYVQRFLFSLAFCFIYLNVGAQPVLPDIIAASDKGINVISWTCQYDGIKSIAVQRSADSIFNYTTIGYVKDLKKGPQAYIDGHPAPGDNWYRLYIAFSSDLTWYSNSIKIHIDSNTLLNKSVIPPNDSLQRYASNVVISADDIVASSTDITNSTRENIVNNTAPATTTPAKTKPKLNLDIPKSENVNQMAYIKSQHVFTNPFTGHVMLELPQDSRKIYSIRFYKQYEENTPVLEIPRIKKQKLIIDKRNFQSKGVYKFVLFEENMKMEEGFISIF